MKGIIVFLAFILTMVLSAPLSSAQEKNSGIVYLFSYFMNNGEDGLHLAFSYDGYSWAPLKDNHSFLSPAAGKDKLMRDPCIIRGADGLFHMVWTVSWNEQGIGYASSRDLIHWSEQYYIPVMAHEPTARNCWAPEILFDEGSSRYMIYWASTIPGRFPQVDSSAEGQYNHRIYYTTTRDFKSFRKTKLLYDPGFSVIDATIAREGRKYIMFLKDETRAPARKNLRLAFSKKAMGKYGDATIPFTDSWVEGPTVIRIGDQWVVYFDRYTRHSMGAVVSHDLKEWRDISDEVHFPEGVRHGTVFTVTSSEFEKLRILTE